MIRENDAEVDIAADLPVVEAHAAHIMQVFQNLIANAVRHNEPGVRVRVTCADEGGHAWRFSVADNGRGVAAADAERIFEPFKRLNLNEEGAGLGLAVAARSSPCTAAGIWYENGEDGGAVFTFTLPRPMAQPIETAAQAKGLKQWRRRQFPWPTSCWSTTVRPMSN